MCSKLQHHISNTFELLKIAHLCSPEQSSAQHLLTTYSALLICIMIGDRMGRRKTNEIAGIAVHHQGYMGNQIFFWVSRVSFE